jgi:asparagine synthase (glutamine-hydrolysing)
MCAITGIISTSITSIDRNWLTASCNSMKHRGPDDYGEWWSSDKTVGLGHRRLSIIDLSSFGQQPMSDVTKEFVIVFNGEIYNYKELRSTLKSRGHSFQTHSDTEVILESWKEWGEKSVERLNGMFTFAIYDKKQKKITIARDRAGEKPLFYMNYNNKLLFSSELKGLIVSKEIDASLNYDSMNSYLSMGFVPGDKSILQGVNKLKPGHLLTYDCTKSLMTIKQYWSPPTPIIGKTDERELVYELDGLLELSVHRQMLADVPVGVLLSGGVDSSLITAMAARSMNQVKTFTASFPGYKKYDESIHANLIASHFSTKHTQLEIDIDMVEPDILITLARQFDEPICDSSMIPTYLVSKLVKQYCTVALGGDGGDELFGGYSHYSRLLWAEKKSKIIPKTIKKAMSIISRNHLPTGLKGRNWLQALSLDFDKELPQIATHFNSNERTQLMSKCPNMLKSILKKDIWRDRTPDIKNLLQQATMMDFNNYMVEDILVKIDRASMLNSLELRSPLLDHKIIDFAFSRTPMHLKATQNDRKIILKNLAKNILPNSFDMTRKQGFEIPLGEWIKKGKFKDFFYDILLNSDCIFDSSMVLSLLKGHEKGRNNTERLFSLVMFELWRREYSIRM